MKPIVVESTVICIVTPAPTSSSGNEFTIKFMSKFISTSRFNHIFALYKNSVSIIPSQKMNSNKR